MKFIFSCLSMFIAINSLFAIRTDPWITQDARDFLALYLEKNPDAKILEFGSGGSTIWFSQRTKNLISYEHDQKFFNWVKNYIKDHKYNPVDLRLQHTPFFKEIANFPDDHFDLVFVDCDKNDRLKCCLFSARVLKPGGILMLDNSERPNLRSVFTQLKNWPCTTTYQTEPDEYDYTYKGWQTTYWTKPKK